jgi:hypothetical protein
MPFIPVTKFEGSPSQVARLLIESNLQREKTPGQKAREAAQLLRIEKALAAEREKAGVTLGPERAKGRSSDIVAKLTGQSRATVEMQTEIVEKAEAGEAGAKEVLEALDRDEICITEAYRDLKEFEMFQADEEQPEDEVSDEEYEIAERASKKRRDAAWDKFQRETAIKAAMIAEAKEIVSAGKKARAIKLHPDTGGSSEGMQNLNSAVDWLLKLITAASPVAVQA